MSSSPSSMIGRTLGQYQVVRLLGSGGMGVVYRARDMRLERDVALKVLAAGTLANDAARARFRQEALALSRLSHPNIATVYDFNTQNGIDFLAFELVPGRALDEQLAFGPLPEKQLLTLGLQLAEGLDSAHRQGIVHRDLKPANLKLDADGRLKILDFGLAKSLQPASMVSDTLSAPPTEGVAGTFPYMSPEQLRGETIDARSDIWAAGVILYELASGKLPFSGKTPAVLADGILHDAPASLHVSERLAQIVFKCLEKDPDQRYQSAKELAVDLRRALAPSTATAVVNPAPARSRLRLVATITVLAAAAAVIAAYLWLRPTSPSIDSVAVLPFVNATGDPASDFLSDGVTADVINHLTEVPALRVIAAPTVMTYKGRQVAPQQVGRELRIAALVMGRMTRSAERVSIQVDIVDTSDGSEIWGGRFEQPFSQVQSLQNDISLEVSRRLRLKLSTAQQSRLARISTTASAAYQNYLRGRYCMSEAMLSKFPDCERLFRQAIAADPQYAQAWAGLADSIAYRAIMDAAPPSSVVAEARAAAQKALEIDPENGEAHVSLGIISLCFDWDYARAEAELKRAMELNPGDTFGRHWYAHYLEATGDVRRGNAELLRVAAIDPLSAMYASDLANEYYILGESHQVIDLSRSWSSVDPLAAMTLAMSYQRIGNKAQAVAALDKLLAGDDSNLALAMAAGGFARMGEHTRAQRLLAKLQQRAAAGYVAPVLLAYACFGLGDDTQGFRYLEAAFQERSPELPLTVNVDPQFERLWKDPRYVALARRYGLPNIHPRHGRA